MKHLTIIVPEVHGNLSTVACIIGAYEIFMRANAYRKESGGNEVFQIQLAGVSHQTAFEHGLLSVNIQIHVNEIRKTHLVLIPSLDRAFAKKPSDGVLIDWISKQYKEGAEVASMCTGAFMLASAGMLDGRSCSTHWCAEDAFRSMFPKVHLYPEKLITDEKGIYTNGGGYSFLNLLIYLVEKYYDRQTAVYCSKIFQIEVDRQSQSDFIIFTGQKQHGDDVIMKAQTYIESRLHEKISIEELCAMFAVGRRNFDRRFVRATGNTPLEYSQRVKIEAAKKAFETTRKTVNEVMYDVGYSDTKSFREVFRKITGLSPLEYRAKYNKEAFV
jgi:transcriptional regulator GlxA family with amidase domain